MSMLFGPMRQVGIVVRDIEKAMRNWVEVCGVGPWFYAEQLKGLTHPVVAINVAVLGGGPTGSPPIEVSAQKPTVSWY
jgi:hypothetical protein